MPFLTLRYSSRDYRVYVVQNNKMVDSKDDDWYLYADDFDLNVSQVWLSYINVTWIFLFW